MTHTQGRLKLGRISHSEQSAEIDAESNTAWMDAYPWEGLAECRGCDENKTRGAAVMEANARRMVACWNLLEGVPTEKIEASTDYGSSWGQCGQELAAMTVQRDELLEALKRIAGASMSMYANRGHMLADAREIAQTAIAKAEGAA